ncbi:MAG: hypothetical protein ABFS17_04700 [Chloroflexota bacterium]
MKRINARISLLVSLAAVIAIVVGLSAAQPAAAAGTTRIPIENNFISCEVASIDRVWVEDGVKHVRGKLVYAEVRSNENYHVGPATNLSNANIELATMYGTFNGKVEMFPDAYPDGGWEGTFVAQGVVGFHTGTSQLKGTGSLKGYKTKLVFSHISGPALHAMFPDACGGNMPLGGTSAVGYVLIPGGE